MIKEKILTRKKVIGSFIILAMSTILLITINKENTRIILKEEVKEPSIHDAVAVYIEDESSDDGYAKNASIPTDGYEFNEEASYCSINGSRDDSISLSYDMSTQTLTVSPITKEGTKCYLYFDKKPSVKDTLLSYYPTVLTRTDFSTTITNTTTGTIYKSADESQYDDDGETYYFAGNPTDNWVSFAGFYWRIIRINGDGTIRLIYSGENKAEISGVGTMIDESSQFNNKYGRSEYVGLKYTEEIQYGTNDNSIIMDKLNTWFQDNLNKTENLNNIDLNAGFCGDRNIADKYEWVSQNYYGYLYYAGYDRVINNTPTYKCTNKLDLYTTNGSSNGNKALEYPIGLITADEAIYAGVVLSKENFDNYLCTYRYYWTMTPHGYDRGDASVYYTGDGFLEASYVTSDSYGIRPVINIRSDATITSGNGTSSQPFQIG